MAKNTMTFFGCTWLAEKSHICTAYEYEPAEEPCITQKDTLQVNLSFCDRSWKAPNLIHDVSVLLI